MDPEGREQWNSQLGFILATVGSAVGLGNVWRFPTVVVQRGGGAFLIVYMAVVLAVGIPLMMAELAMGRRSRKGVVGAFRILGRADRWGALGLIGALAVFMILAYYAVIAGWTFLYTILGLSGQISGLTVEALADLFDSITGGVLPLYGQAVFLIAACSIVYFGVTSGIERWGKILTPGIVFLLLLLLGRVLLLEGGPAGAWWFLRPDFSRLSFPVVLDAVGQVFFSFSLGMGAVLTYGSYLNRQDSIPRSSLIIGFFDVAIAVLAGLVVTGALFAFGIEPEVGFGLVFVALPAVFNTLPAAAFWGSAFFLALSFAALTSVISFLEVLVAMLMEEMRWTRPAAVLTIGVATFIAGIPAALSGGLWAHVQLWGLDIMGFVDAVASNIALPLSGIATVVFVGWVWGIRRARSEVSPEDGTFPLAGAWSIIIRYIAPLALTYVMIRSFLL